MRHPALVLTYRRIDSALQICAQLAILGVKNIYVSIDGGRSPMEIQNQKESLIQFETIAKKFDIHIYVRHASQNMGVAVGVISGIDWFFQNVNSGYILEDDLIFDHDFLDFCDLGLDKLQNFPNIWMISGNQYLDSQGKYIWTNYPLIWGWATWKVKWEFFRKKLSGAEISWSSDSTPSQVRRFWKTGYKRALSGILDSWAVPFATQMRQSDGLSLLPPVNLVSNKGVDDFATHTQKRTWHTNRRIEKLNHWPSYLQAWKAIPSKRQLTAQNKLLEKMIYKIRLRHFFIEFYSFMFDRFRFGEGKNLLARLSDSHASLPAYYFYNCD